MNNIGRSFTFISSGSSRIKTGVNMFKEHLFIFLLTVKFSERYKKTSNANHEKNNRNICKC